MPYEEIYIQPEVLIEVEHITIYYAYDNCNADDRFVFWYTAEHDEAIKEETWNFDVRELPNWGWKNNSDRNLHADVIKEALYHGYLDKYLKEIGIEPISKGDEANE